MLTFQYSLKQLLLAITLSCLAVRLGMVKVEITTAVGLMTTAIAWFIITNDWGLISVFEWVLLTLWFFNTAIAIVLVQFGVLSLVFPTG